MGKWDHLKVRPVSNFEILRLKNAGFPVNQEKQKGGKGQKCELSLCFLS